MLRLVTAQRFRGVLLCSKGRAASYRPALRFEGTCELPETGVVLTEDSKTKVFRRLEEDIQNLRCGQGWAVERSRAEPVPSQFSFARPVVG